MARITEQVSESVEVVAGHSPNGGVPLVLHSRRALGAGFARLMEERLAACLKGLGSRVERLTVRFEDLNGPKGGVDTACRIQLKLSGEPPFIVGSRAEDEARAFRAAHAKLTAALDRRHSRRAAKPRATLRQPFARAS